MIHPDRMFWMQIYLLFTYAHSTYASTKTSMYVCLWMEGQGLQGLVSILWPAIQWWFLDHESGPQMTFLQMCACSYVSTFRYTKTSCNLHLRWVWWCWSASWFFIAWYPFKPSQWDKQIDWFYSLYCHPDIPAQMQRQHHETTGGRCILSKAFELLPSSVRLG